MKKKSHALDIPAFLKISQERRKEAWREFSAKKKSSKKVEG